MNRTLLTVITVAFATAASAGADEYRFAYTKADFADESSVQALHKRITRTARDFCPRYQRSSNLAESSSCNRSVTDEIVQSIDNPALTAMHEGELGDVRIALEQQRHGDAKSG